PAAFGQRARDHRGVVLVAAHAHADRLAAQQPFQSLCRARQPAGAALAGRADPVRPCGPGGAGGRLRPRHDRPDRESGVQLRPGQGCRRGLQRHPLNQRGRAMEWTSIRTTLIAAAIAAALPGVAHAVRVDYTIDGGYEHDDNVTLSEVDPIETDIARLGVGFSVEQASSVVRASVVGRIDHRRYQDVFDDMTDRMLEGRLHWEVVPDRLAFVVEDSYGVQTINRFSPDAPDNRQQVNVLSLGPTFMFRPGNLRGLAELRYINS